MENFFIVAIVLLNFFAISMLYKMLSGTEKSYRIKVVVVLSIITLGLSYVIYGISSIGMLPKLKAISKPLLLFTIFPINIITMASPLAILLNKVNSEEINKEDFNKRIIKMLIIDLIFIVIEFIFLKNIHLSIMSKIN